MTWSIYLERDSSQWLQYDTTMQAQGRDPSRRIKAKRTRALIVGAAHEEFLARGYHGATIAAIAGRAGVAPQTVYFVFHTKSALLSAAIDAAVLGPDETPPDQSDWWRAMVAAPDGEETLARFVRGAGPVYARAAGISEVLRAAAMDDDECRATWLHHDRIQVEAFRQVIDLVRSKSRLRPGLDVDRATDVLITLFGDSTYHLLTAERGWSAEQTLTWMAEALAQLLLAPDPAIQA